MKNMKTFTIEIKELDKKPKAISTIVYEAFKKRQIPIRLVNIWWTKHNLEWLIARFWWLEWKMNTNPVRSPIAYLIMIIEKEWPLPEQFLYWRESKKRKILDDPKASSDLKRLISL